MAVREVAGAGWFVDPQAGSINDPTAVTDERNLALGVDERLLAQVDRDGRLFTAALPFLTIEEERKRVKQRAERLAPVSGWPIGRAFRRITCIHCDTTAKSGRASCSPPTQIG